MKKVLFSFVLGAGLLTSCNSSDNSSTATTDSPQMAAPTVDSNTAPVAAADTAGIQPTKSIVDNAVASSAHSTLVAAVKAAGLAEVLAGPGPFTVFAPTNDAFAKLPAGTVENLLKPENLEQLKSVLTYHVVPGVFKAADLKDGQKLKTAQGKELTVSIKDGKVMIDGAQVSAVDITSSNGVIHVLDGVVLPKK